MSNLPLFDFNPSAQPGAGITRLYEYLELFSEGEPLRHTLFVLGRPTLAEHNPLQAATEQRLIIDPPLDVSDRFRLDGDIAVISTAATVTLALPHVQTAAWPIFELGPTIWMFTAKPKATLSIYRH
jgi:hypothetical protein